MTPMKVAPTLRPPKSRQPVKTELQSFHAQHSLAELKAMGKALRDKCPRDAHAEWKPPHNRPDPVGVVLKTDEGRIPDLIPLRHGRMAMSPFTFYRGSAFAMAQDLAGTPSTGIRVQCGGDSHLVNFRGLASAERQVIFALNDLDETPPGALGVGPQAACGERRGRMPRQRTQRIRRQGCGPRLCQVLPRAHGRVQRNESPGPVVLRPRSQHDALEH